MSYAVAFDAGRRRFVVTQTGADDWKSALEAMRSVRTDPAYQPTHGILCDFRAGDFSGDTQDWLRMATAVRSLFHGQRIALVFALPERASAGRVVRAAAAPDATMKVFADLGSAETWLDAPAA